MYRVNTENGGFNPDKFRGAEGHEVLTWLKIRLSQFSLSFRGFYPQKKPMEKKGLLKSWGGLYIQYLK